MEDAPIYVHFRRPSCAKHSHGPECNHSHVPPDSKAPAENETTNDQIEMVARGRVEDIKEDDENFPATSEVQVAVEVKCTNATALCFVL